MTAEGRKGLGLAMEGVAVGEGLGETKEGDQVTLGQDLEEPGMEGKAQNHHWVFGKSEQHWSMDCCGTYGYRLGFPWPVSICLGLNSSKSACTICQYRYSVCEQTFCPVD